MILSAKARCPSLSDHHPAHKIADSPESGGPGIWEFTLNEKMSPISRIYQVRVTGVPWGIGYRVNGKKFDGYRNGVLLDAKGDYDQFIQPDGEFIGFMESYFRNLARKQLEVAGATPIQWIFMQERSAILARQLLADEGIVGIDVVWVP